MQGAEGTRNDGSHEERGANRVCKQLPSLAKSVVAQRTAVLYLLRSMGRRAPSLRSMLMSLRRYGALKSLGEKKACFHEYAQQRKNEEKDEAAAKVRVFKIWMVIQSA